MKAIILAAGLGNRLKPLTDSVPKCLTEVGGTSILANALECLDRSPVEEAVLVVGYLAEWIREFGGSRHGRLKIRYVENDRYGQTGTAASLLLAFKDLGTVETPVLVLEGDVFFEQAVLDSLVAHGGENVTVVEKYHPALDGTFTAVDGESFVSGWWHASRRPRGFVLEDKFKTVNLHRFSPAFVRETLVPALERVTADSRGEAPMEFAMEEIVGRNGKLIQALETGGARWCEIDDLDDLERAERLFRFRCPAWIGLEEMRGFHGGYWRYDFLDFHYPRNAYFPPAEMVRTLQEDLPHLVTHYPSAHHVIARLLSRWKDEPSFREDLLVVANGSSELIRVLGRLVSPVMVPVPTFNEYLEMPAERIRIFPLPEEERFRLDAEKFLEAVRRSGSDFAVICNPNNPVGDLVSREDIALLLEGGVRLIVDEAFIDWSGPGCSCEDMVQKYGNLVVIKSLTKVAGIPGLRLGYMLTSDRPLREAVRRALPIWNVNAVAERFVELFPRYAGAFEESMRKGREDRRYMMERLREVSCLEPFDSRAGFILCRCALPARELGKYLYERHGMMIRDSLTQAVPAAGRYIRLAVRPRAEVDRLIAALVRACAECPPDSGPGP
jgi:histidinol-phosphate/aromatic aminotransferase/cobyric acid decarboxylase-like protein/choline kinase